MGHAREFYSRFILWQNNLLPGDREPCYLSTGALFILVFKQCHTSKTNYTMLYELQIL